MNWLTRIGAILITLSITLGIIALVRGSSSETAGWVFDMSPLESEGALVYLSPRDLIITINTPKDVSLNLTDQQNNTILTVQNFTNGDSVKLHIEKREVYTVKLYNSYNTVQFVQLEFTLYNFEADITQAAIALAIAGIAIIAANQIWQKTRLKQKLQHHN